MTRSVRPLPCPKLTLMSCAATGAVAMRIPATPTATVTRRTRRLELRVTISLVDGPASWPSPLRDFRRGFCRGLGPAHAARALNRTWVRSEARILVLPSARTVVCDRAEARVHLGRFL